MGKEISELSAEELQELANQKREEQAKIAFEENQRNLEFMKDKLSGVQYVKVIQSHGHFSEIYKLDPNIEPSITNTDRCRWVTVGQLEHVTISASVDKREECDNFYDKHSINSRGMVNIMDGNHLKEFQSGQKPSDMTKSFGLDDLEGLVVIDEEEYNSIKDAIVNLQSEMVRVLKQVNQ